MRLPIVRPLTAAIAALSLSACAAAPVAAPKAASPGSLATQPAPATAADPTLITTSIAPFRIGRAADARTVLGTRDAFVASLGPFDRALRVGSTTPVDDATYLAFAAKQGLDWTPEEEERLRRVVGRVDARAKKRGITLSAFAPAEVQIIKTTGKEEFGFPYTRGAAIIIPAATLDEGGDDALTTIMVHELFHVLSRNSAKLRESAYRLIGFERSGDLKVPAAMEPIRITNPDGYKSDYALTLPRGGALLHVVPFLVSKKPAFDPKVGTSVLDYADFQLLVVTQSNGGGQEVEVEVARRKDGQLDVLDPEQTDYLHCVGRNTTEIIHPDEVMADNFVRVLARAQQHPLEEPTPALVDAFEALLRTGASAARAAPAARCTF